MRIDGRDLKAAQKRLRLKDAEICAEAGIAMGTLRRVYENHPKVTEVSVAKVSRAIETLRRKMLQSYESRAVG